MFVDFSSNVATEILQEKYLRRNISSRVPFQKEH